MNQYIDGYVFPIPKNCLDKYTHLAEAVAEIWKEHGALEYREHVGDDLHLESTRSFTDAVAASGDDIIVFGWIVFESREARDHAHSLVASDPRVAALMESSDSGFEADRMAWGGFRPLF